MKLASILAASLCLVAFAATAADKKAAAPKPEPYPTQTKVLYVLQCMEVNGKSPENLQKCSCGIDAIEAQLPFELYEMADTGLQLNGVPGNRAAAIRSVNTVKDAIELLRKAQADSNLKCF